MTTYAELVTQIRDYTETDAAVLTTTIVNGIIDHAEDRIYRDIELPIDNAYETSTTAAGTPFVAMPGANITEMTTIKYAQTYTTVNNVPQDRTFMVRKDLSFMNEYWPKRATQAAAGVVPKYYAVWDTDTIYIAPTPNSVYGVEIAITKQPPGLSTSNTTTWLGTNAPRVLLYAALCETFKYLKGPVDMLQLYESSYKEALQALAQEQLGKKKRDVYRDGDLRVAIPSNNP
jgi:hypothetical protein